jgi:RNA polymerase sigma factor (sigma-70 family)
VLFQDILPHETFREARPFRQCQKEGGFMGSSHQPYEVSAYLKKVNQYPFLNLDEELDLARRYRAGDEQAGQRLVQANLRHVVTACRPFFGQGHQPMDIIQEGNVGLMRALSTFDPERGVKFFSYAVWWVRCCVMNFLGRSRKPQHGLLGLAPGIVSIDAVMSDASGTEERFVDHISDNAPSQEESMMSRQEPVILLKVLDHEGCPLSPRERHVIQRRYLDEPRSTLGEVALSLNVTKERVRQIENESLRKMKRHLREHFGLGREDVIAGLANLNYGQERFLQQAWAN